MLDRTEKLTLIHLSHIKGDQGLISQMAFKVVIQSSRKFLYALMLILLYWSNHIAILHMSQQLSFCEICKIATWSNHDLWLKIILFIFQDWIMRS